MMISSDVVLLEYCFKDIEARAAIEKGRVELAGTQGGELFASPRLPRQKRDHDEASRESFET